MNDLDIILTFVTRLGKEMYYTGANLERVNFAIARVLKAYGVKDISIHSLSNFISVNGTDRNGYTAQCQITIPPQSINLGKLRTLNSLSYDIEKNRPDVKDLLPMLDKALDVKDLPWYVVLFGFIIAMATLARIFGGGWAEIGVVELNTLILFGISKLFSRFSLNKIVSDFTSMFIVTAVALLFTYLGLVKNFYIVIITNAFYLIPGIPMVNSVRNILCGNEMNGIIELFKVVLEVVAIVAGLAASLFLFGGWYDALLEESIVTSDGSLLSNIELVVLSFLCSFGFGLVFMIHHKNILLAALGGMIIRMVYIPMMILVPNYRIVYATVAAFAAAVYAEIIAYVRHEPSTLYLYPSIVPLIPGDLFYYACLGIVWTNSTLAVNNAVQCLLQLVGMSVGFVLCSIIKDAFRKIHFHKIVAEVDNVRKNILIDGIAMRETKDILTDGIDPKSKK